MNTGFSGECECSKGVHDEVDPKHLDAGEGRLFEDDAPHEGHEDGHDVDGDLEGKELADALEDVPAPLHGGDDGGEVVIEEDDGRGVFGDLGAGDAHSEADICLFEGGSIVGAVTSNGHDVVELFEAGHQDELVLRRGSGEDLEVSLDIFEVGQVSDECLSLVVVLDALHQLPKGLAFHHLQRVFVVDVVR